MLMIMELDRKNAVFDTFTMEDLITMRQKRKFYFTMKPKPKLSFKIVSL